MLNSGDIVDLELGTPTGREAGYQHPAVIVTAQRVLDAEPSVVHVVPLTTTLRRFHSEIVVEPDHTNGLAEVSAAQCQHVRAVARERVLDTRSNVGAAALAQIRETIALLLDLP